MKIFVFDTETTGFINKKNTDLIVQPHIVQFAGISGEINDGEYSEISRINTLIKPKIPIPFGASQVHHIYDIDIKNAPDISGEIENFMKHINNADVVIGHNIEYDEDVMRVELKRLEKEYLYKPKQSFCTMKTTVDFCAIRGKGERFKYPKLGELYKKLFGEYFIGAHDAMIDVEATMKIFIELHQRGLTGIKKTKQEVMSLF